MINLKAFFLSIILTIVVLFPAGVVLAVDNSALIAQLQAQITELLRQVEQLRVQQSQNQQNQNQQNQNQQNQNQQNEPPHNSTDNWCHDFTFNLGFINSGSSEVASLHMAFDRENISYIPDTINQYGAGTEKAVRDFQQKYASEILTPMGRTETTGFVGESTRRKLNDLYSCHSRNTSTVDAYMRVTSPNGGETLTIGQPVNITWQTNLADHRFTIYLVDYSQGIEFVKGIIAAPLSASAGSYSWSVSSSSVPWNQFTLTPGDRYKIKIIDQDGTQYDYSDNYFNVATAGAPLTAALNLRVPSTPQGSGALVSVNRATPFLYGATPDPYNIVPVIINAGSAFTVTAKPVSGYTGIAMGTCDISSATFGQTYNCTINYTTAGVCTPNWSCGKWSGCSNSQQTRICTDSFNCGVSTGRPPLTQNCQEPLGDPYVTLLSPNGYVFVGGVITPARQTLTIGQTYDITWRTNTNNEVNIFLCEYDTSSWDQRRLVGCYTIGSAPALAGVYSWTVPAKLNIATGLDATITPGNNYRIGIRLPDGAVDTTEIDYSDSYITFAPSTSSAIATLAINAPTTPVGAGAMVSINGATPTPYTHRTPQTINAGNSFTVTAKPIAGYTTTLSGTCASSSALPNQNYVCNITYVPVRQIATLTVNVSNTPQGSGALVSINNGTPFSYYSPVTMNTGSAFAVTAKAVTGYTASLSGNCTGSSVTAGQNYACVVNYTPTGLPPINCTPSWQCTNWTTCSGSQQSRTCADANNCGTTTGRPALTQACSSTGLFITVTSPNGGESLVIGQQQNITWETNLTGRVYVYFVYYENPTLDRSFGVSVIKTIPVGIANASAKSISWKVGYENTILRGNPGSYKIKIQDIGSDIYNIPPTGTQDFSDNFFNIVLSATPPAGSATLTVNAPNTPVGAGAMVSVNRGLPIIYSAPINLSVRDTFVVTPAPVQGYNSTISGACNLSSGAVNNQKYVCNIAYTAITLPPSTCTPNWQCANWTTCSGSRQSRVCTDSNNCGVITGRPPLTQSCVPVQPSITVTSPTTGASLIAGSTQTITWTTTGSVPNIILYLYKGNTFAQNIFSPYTHGANQGSKAWTIPTTLVAGNDYKIKAVKYGDPTVFDESESFSITTASPATARVVVELPNAPVGAGAMVSVNGGVATPYFAPISLGAVNRFIVTAKPVSGYTATTTGSCNISSATAGQNYVCNIVYSQESASGAITVTSPNGGESFAFGSMQNITWTMPESWALKRLRIDLYELGNDTLINIAPSVSNTNTYNWRVPAGLGGGIRIYKIRISELYNPTVYDESDDYFSITMYPRSITVTSPNGGDSFSAGSTQSITWTSEGDLPHSSVKISLYKAGRFLQDIVGLVANNGIYGWTVPAGLVAGSDYKVRVSVAFRSEYYGESDFFSINVAGVSAARVVVELPSSPQGAGATVSVNNGPPITYSISTPFNLNMRDIFVVTPTPVQGYSPISSGTCSLSSGAVIGQSYICRINYMPSYTPDVAILTVNMLNAPQGAEATVSVNNGPPVNYSAPINLSIRDIFVVMPAPVQGYNSTVSGKCHFYPPSIAGQNHVCNIVYVPMPEPPVAGPETGTVLTVNTVAMPDGAPWPAARVDTATVYGGDVFPPSLSMVLNRNVVTARVFERETFLKGYKVLKSGDCDICFGNKGYYCRNPQPRNQNYVCTLTYIPIDDRSRLAVSIPDRYYYAEKRMFFPKPLGAGATVSINGGPFNPYSSPIILLKGDSFEVSANQVAGYGAMLRDHCKGSHVTNTTYNYICNIGYVDWQLVSIADAYVSLTSPNNQETWRVGETKTITWNSQSLQNVHLYVAAYDGQNNLIGTLSLSGGSSIPSASGENEYDWTIPANPLFVNTNSSQNIFGTPAKRYKILVHDAAAPALPSVPNPVSITGAHDFSENYLSIISPQCNAQNQCVMGGGGKECSANTDCTTSSPNLHLGYPNGGQTIAVGDVYNIRWSSNLPGNIDIELRNRNTGVNYIIASGVPASRGSYSWTVRSDLTSPTGLPLVGGTRYEMIISSPSQGLADSSNYYFTISVPEQPPAATTASVTVNVPSSPVGAGALVSIGGATAVPYTGPINVPANTNFHVEAKAVAGYTPNLSGSCNALRAMAGRNYECTVTYSQEKYISILSLTNRYVAWRTNLTGYVKIYLAAYLPYTLQPRETFLSRVSAQAGVHYYTINQAYLSYNPSGTRYKIKITDDESPSRVYSLSNFFTPSLSAANESDSDASLASIAGAIQRIMEQIPQLQF